MAVDRTERLLNLVLCLMATRRAVSRAEIQRTIPGYGLEQSPAAFERMFERDKDELRSMGIPVETVVDANGEVEGYRIPAEQYGLPALSIDADEAAVLTLAAQVWDEAVLAPEAVSALRKLEAAAGRGAHEDAGDRTFVRHGGDDATILTLMAAVREHRVLRFAYTTADGRRAERIVDPWAVIARSGSWYLVGHDHDRAAMRAFRVSRIDGPVTVTRLAATTPRPPGIDLQAALDVDQGPTVTARVAVRAGHGAALRRLASATEDASRDGDASTQDAVLLIEHAPWGRLVGELCAAGAGAVVLEPEELRSEVVERLQAIAKAHR